MRPPFDIVDHPSGPRFWLSGAWQESYAEHFNNPEIQEIYITWNNWLYPVSNTDLSFVSTLKSVRNFRIFSAEKVSIKPVESCPWLEAVEIDVPKQKEDFNFSLLPNLLKARVKYQKSFNGLFSCTTTQQLFIENFPSHDLSCLAEMKALLNLEIIKSKKLLSLEGWHSLPSLKRIYLYRCEVFTDRANLPAEIRLETEACNKFQIS